MTQVAAALFRDLGLNLDVALSGWGTVIQRRASREPVEKGGWSALLTAFGTFDWMDRPATPCCAATAPMPGWLANHPSAGRVARRLVRAPTVEAQKSVFADLQRAMFEEVLCIPVGAYYSKTA